MDSLEPDLVALVLEPDSVPLVLLVVSVVPLVSPVVLLVHLLPKLAEVTLILPKSVESVALTPHLLEDSVVQASMVSTHSLKLVVSAIPVMPDPASEDSTISVVVHPSRLVAMEAMVAKRLPSPLMVATATRDTVLLHMVVKMAMAPVLTAPARAMVDRHLAMVDRHLAMVDRHLATAAKTDMAPALPADTTSSGEYATE